MKHLLLASLITLLAFSTACGQASEPEPVASDGIQVHGHWTVTVTNPDGTLDAVHEFDNDFVNIGLLPNLLSGKNRIDGSYFRLLVTSNEKLSCLEQDGTTLNNGIYLESQINVEESYGLPFSISATCTVLTTPTTSEQSQAIKWMFTDFRDYNNCFDKWSETEEKVYCSGTAVKVMYLTDGSLSKTNQQYNYLTSTLTSHQFQPPLSVWNSQQIGFNVKISFN